MGRHAVPNRGLRRDGPVRISHLAVVGIEPPIKFVAAKGSSGMAPADDSRVAQAVTTAPRRPPIAFTTKRKAGVEPAREWSAAHAPRTRVGSRVEAIDQQVPATPTVQRVGS